MPAEADTDVDVNGDTNVDIEVENDSETNFDDDDDDTGPCKASKPGSSETEKIMKLCRTWFDGFGALILR